MDELLGSYAAKSAAELPPQPHPKKPKSGRPKREPFLKGPIPLAWLARAHEAGGAALAVGLVLWFVRGVSGKAGPVRIGASVRKRLGVSPDQGRRGLQLLEGAGLVYRVKGGRGRCAVVELRSDRLAALPSRGDGAVALHRHQTLDH